MKSQYVAEVSAFYASKMNLVYTGEQNGNRTIRNHHELSRFIADLKKREIVPDVISEITGPIEKYLSHGSDAIVLSLQDAVKFEQTIDTLRLCLKCIAKSIESTLVADDERTVHIKLPALKDYGDFSDIIRDLNNSIAVTIRDTSINSSMEVNGFDNGSLWIRITIGSIVGLNIVGGIVYAGYAVMNKQKEYEAVCLTIRNAKIASDHAEAVQKGINDSIRLLVEAEAKALMKANKIEENVELANKLTHSIERMSVLLHRGMELHPSQKVNIESQKEFPKIENIPLIQLRSVNLEYSGGKKTD